MISYPTKHSYRIYMIGICGAGMSGIAIVLRKLGHHVQGSDTQAGGATASYLRTLGICVHATHQAQQLAQAEVVVYSSAISADNCELVEAKKRGIACMSRAEMLADLIRYSYGIAVAGTHGKTTTTSLMQAVFVAAAKQPTYIIGGRLLSQDANAHLGESKYFIVEADESDASFKHIQPVVAVITNIDKDHMGTYHHDFDLLKSAYINFIHNTPFYGTAFVCKDDVHIKTILSSIHRRVISYGLDTDCDYYATDIVQGLTHTEFMLHTPTKCYPIALKLHGKHNVLNALAALAVGDQHNIEAHAMQEALAHFSGVNRRFNNFALSLFGKQVHVIDDYGHHPTEIRATLETAKNLYVGRRLVLVFQPHRYSRTKELFEDFVLVLEQADAVILQATHAAGEEPLEHFDTAALCRAIELRKNVPVFADTDNQEVLKRLADFLAPQDVLVIQGAGSIGELAGILRDASEA